MNSGQTVFAQLMFFIPQREFNQCVDRYDGNYHTHKFTCYDQFLVMCFAQYARRNSLRDIESSLVAVSHKLYHSGISHAVARNTLAKANENRCWRIYSDFAQVLIKKVRPLYQDDSSFSLDIDNMVYAFDSTTISLCFKLCPWAKFRTTKSGIKIHTLLELKSNLPIFIHLTNASVHDVKILEKLYIEPAAIYVMDKGYIDFFKLYHLIHTKRAFFVTRAKENMDYAVIKSVNVDKQPGVVSDEIIKLTNYQTFKTYPENLRLVTYKDEATDKVYKFLSNQMEFDSLTIAQLYKERWNIELFFKWMKQHLHIKSFYGTSENAVYTQIWISVCAFLILALAKKKLEIDVSLYTFAQTLGLFLFERTSIKDLFNKIKTPKFFDQTPNLFSLSEI